ncbi:TPA: hypothetical protein DCX16_04040 [bacterium]|nr:hypothetical protein [bacterium]
MEEKTCEYFEVEESGYFICKKITRGSSRITKDICKAHCPVFEKKCSHLAFSLRKDEVFSAIGLGGRRYEINIERAVCDKLKEAIFDIKKCNTCELFEEKGEISIKEEPDIIRQGLKVLIEHLGEEKTRLFIEKMKSRPKKEESKEPSLTKNDLDEEIERWLSIE